jgi:hypothetical protein
MITSGSSTERPSMDTRRSTLPFRYVDANDAQALAERLPRYLSCDLSAELSGERMMVETGCSLSPRALSAAARFNSCAWTCPIS